MLIALCLSILLGASACSPAAEHAEPPPLADRSVERPPLTQEERTFYLDAARLAWQYMDRYYQPATGFVNATPEWPYTTIWDIGGQLLAFLSARDLGLIEPDEYERRTRTALNTLERVPLFRNAAFNKLYSTTNGSMGAGGERGGRGWSATDLGRLLVALYVLSTREPRFGEQADRIVRRIRFDEVVRGGYLHGQMIGNSGRPWRFQEGRIGYEQYVATGFQAWGANVANALDFQRHAEPVEVHGVRIVRDRRWQDRLVSEPFVLLGIELGFTPEIEQLAVSVLAAQEARYHATGSITIASEDALPYPPYYFYYYCIYGNNRPFVIDAASPGDPLQIPRWVSTKATFGWHALMPSDYTRRALDYVSAARDENFGWASGVFEDSRVSTGSYDINTAAVLLEVAAFQLRGARPLIEPAAAVQGDPPTAQSPSVHNSGP